jgi:type IV pilus biogenesis protein CpaD/CtpE
MKRLAILAAIAAAGLTACSSTDTSFHTEGGVCYRTRIEKTLGITTSTRTVQAIPENCG